MKNLTFLCLLFISISLSRAADKKTPASLDVTQLGVSQKNTDADVSVHNWNLGGTKGSAVDYNRTFRIDYNFYTVKDRMVVTYPDASGRILTKDIGVQGGIQKFEFLVPANITPKVTVTVTADEDKSSWLVGQRTRRVGWDYVMSEIRAVSVSGETLQTAEAIPIPNSITTVDSNRPWRVTLGGNKSVTRKVNFIEETFFPRYAKLYQFNVPAGTSCLRIMYDSDEDSQLSLRKNVPPKKGAKIGESIASLGNSSIRKTVVVNDSSTEPLAGKWFLYVSAIDNHSGEFELCIDCLQGGQWASVSRADGKQTETIAVGIECSYRGENKLIPTSERMTLMSHGRVDSPLGNMGTLGTAVSLAWGRPTFHINWSEGSFWNTGLGYNGSRFIPASALKINALIGNTNTVDFFGHSWGTYVGFELNRSYHRFFALDPAKEGFGYTDSKINFSIKADYSLGIYGNGFAGNKTLTQTATDAILLNPEGVDYGLGKLDEILRAHAEPVLFMAYLFRQQTTFAAEKFGFAYSLSDNITADRSWITGFGYRDGVVDTQGFNKTILHKGYNAQVVTNGYGVPNLIRYRKRLEAGQAGDKGFNFKVIDSSVAGDDYHYGY